MGPMCRQNWGQDQPHDIMGDKVIEEQTGVWRLEQLGRECSWETRYSYRLNGDGESRMDGGCEVLASLVDRSTKLVEDDQFLMRR